MIDWRARVSPEEFDRYRGLLLAPASGGRAPQPAGGAPGAPAATPQAASLHKAAPPPKAACRSRQASRQDSRRRARSDGGGCAPGGRARASVSPGLRLVRRARRFYQPLGRRPATSPRRPAERRAGRRRAGGATAGAGSRAPAAVLRDNGRRLPLAAPALLGRAARRGQARPGPSAGRAAGGGRQRAAPRRGAAEDRWSSVGMRTMRAA
ncbi:unnamed protein product [Prorocentrum cordatum]|uniref:Uncharacterized protein n=1 Tax=Prorocentrum cordatum TaxID=2364126 RepID=A0ABN9TTP3_9DINO|nr:unnamed protein product [Polarella glacialis]